MDLTSSVLTFEPKYVPIPNFGVVVLESRHARNWSGPTWFNEDFHKFLFVVSGAVKLSTPEKMWSLRKDSLVHVTAHARHSNIDIPAEPVVVYVIHYRENILPVVLASALSRQAVTSWILPTSHEAKAVRQDFQEMLYEQVIRRAGWQALLIGLLIQLSVRALRTKERRQLGSDESVTGPSNLTSLGRVASYIESLETCFFQQQSLDEAAAKAGLSRRRFTDLFRRQTGNSWQQHLLSLRLKHGARLLKETGKSVTEIMFECGFDDLSHFHHTFKAAFKCSPGAYREKSGAIGAQNTNSNCLKPQDDPEFPD